MSANDTLDWEKFNEIVESRKEEKWSLIPLLQEIQEHFGYIPPETIEPVAKALHMRPSRVQGVITFYSGFSLKPKGKCVVRVCRGTACHVKGGRGILRMIKNDLNLEEGQTSEDFSFTLETVACLGACFLAPTMMTNRDYYGKLSPKKVSSVLNQHRKDKGDD